LLKVHDKKIKEYFKKYIAMSQDVHFAGSSWHIGIPVTPHFSL